MIDGKPVKMRRSGKVKRQCRGCYRYGMKTAVLYANGFLKLHCDCGNVQNSKLAPGENLNETGLVRV